MATNSEIVERIKQLSAPADLEETTDEALEPIDASEDDALSDEVNEPAAEHEPIVEELDENEQAETETIDDGEESYFDIDGEEITLSQIREWKDGGLRMSDYTKKTTGLADTRKELERKQADYDASISDLNAKVAELEGFIRDEEASIDWDELAEHDPAEYLKQQRKLDAKKAAIKTAQAQQTAQRETKLAEESNILIGKMAGWSDTKVMNAEFQAAVDYAKDIGLDLSGVSDHRLYMALVDASKYKAIDSNKAITAKKVRQAPKAVKATKGRAKPKSTDMQAAKDRLKASGSRSDALAAIRLLKTGN